MALRQKHTKDVKNTKQSIIILVVQRWTHVRSSVLEGKSCERMDAEHFINCEILLNVSKCHCYLLFSSPQGIVSEFVNRLSVNKRMDLGLTGIGGSWKNE